MTRRERVAIGLIAGAVALGILGDVVFRGRPLGINALVFAAAFVLTLTALLRLGRIPLHQGRRLMVIPLILFAGLLCWHDSRLLLAANLMAIAGAVMLGALRRNRSRVLNAEISDYVVGAAAVGASTLAGAIELMEKDVPWEGIGRRLRARDTAAIGRGLALGVPLLALFGGLFIAADAVFKSFLIAAAPDVGQMWTHVVIASVIGWLSAGLLRDLLAAREEERLIAPAVAAIRPPKLRIGATEVAVALGSLNVLFLVFVLVQLRYLFGGEGLVASRVDLTYAEYARHGFFELVAVALLVLPLLIAAHSLVRGDGGRPARIVRLASGALIALVLVVMASALERMYLYQREFGLTELRIYATGVILWLGCVFVWLAFTALRGRPKLFASGAVLAGFVATLALNVVNPDALIAGTNLSRPQVDAAYLGSLSDDAVPVLLERLPSLDPNLRRQIAAALLERADSNGAGVLGWNASRSKADSLLAARRAELVAFAEADTSP